MLEPEAGQVEVWAVKYATEAQARVLRFICAHYAERGYPPTILEIGDGLGLVSKQGTHYHITRLVAKGYLERVAYCSRGLRILRTADGEPWCDGTPWPDELVTTKGVRLRRVRAATRGM